MVLSFPSQASTVSRRSRGQFGIQRNTNLTLAEAISHKSEIRNSSLFREITQVSHGHFIVHSTTVSERSERFPETSSLVNVAFPPTKVRRGRTRGEGRRRKRHRQPSRPGKIKRGYQRRVHVHAYTVSVRSVRARANTCTYARTLDVATCLSSAGDARVLRRSSSSHARAPPRVITASERARALVN